MSEPEIVTSQARVEIRARQTYRTLVIICAAVGIGIVFLAGISLILAPAVSGTAATSAPLAPSTGGVLLLVFLVVGASAVFAALWLRGLFVSSAPNEGDLEAALARIRMGIILGCAFSEIPAMLGLVYTVIGGSLVWWPVFFGGSLVSWVLVFPRPSQWAEWLSSIDAGMRSGAAGAAVEPGTDAGSESPDEHPPPPDEAAGRVD